MMEKAPVARCYSLVLLAITFMFDGMCMAHNATFMATWQFQSARYAASTILQAVDVNCFMYLKDK